MWKGFKIAAFSTYLRLKNDDAGSADANVRSLEWSLCERASVVLIAVGRLVATPLQMHLQRIVGVLRG